MNNNEFKKGIAVGVAVTLVVTGTGFVGYQKIMFPKGSALSDTKTVQKLNYLESLINEEYLEEKEEDSLREGLYAGLMSGLNDPYSTYYTAEQYKELNTSNEGSYVGIGAVLQKDKDGGAKIVQLYEGGSGEQAGLKKGDVLKAIDGEDVTEKVFELEERRPTTIGSQIAMAHVYKDSVKKSGIAVMRMKYPVKWSRSSKVKIVFFLAINMEESNEILKLFKYLYALIDNKEDIQKILEANSSGEIYELLMEEFH